MYRLFSPRGCILKAPDSSIFHRRAGTSILRNVKRGGEELFRRKVRRQLFSSLNFGYVAKLGFQPQRLSLVTFDSEA